MPSLGAVWPAIVIGVLVFFLVIVASIDVLSVVPGQRLWLCHGGRLYACGRQEDELTAANFTNPLVLVVGLRGDLRRDLGYLMGQLANMLKAK